MIWILFVLLLYILLTILLFMSKDLDLSNPNFLLVAIYAISVFFVILNYDNWNVSSFKSKTVIIIVVAICAWLIGSIIGKCFYKILPKKFHKISIYYTYLSNKPIEIKNTFCILTAILIIVFAIIYLVELIKNSRVGFGGFATFMLNTRQMLKDNEISISILATQVFSMSRALAMVFTFSFVWNIVNFKKKSLIYLIVPICYLLMSLLTSARIYLLYYFGYCFVLYFMVSSSKRSFRLKDIIKIFFKVVISGCLVLIFFASLANVVGRNSQHTIFEQVSVYFGGPLISFDKFFSNYHYSKPQVFGEESLIGIYQFMTKIGITDVTLNRHLNYIQFGNNWGNVYSALRRYIHDYGYVCSILLFEIIGFFYSFFHTKICNSRRPKKSYVIYAMLSYPIIMMPIDDVLLSSLFSINTVYDIFYVIVFYNFFINKKIFNKIYI